VTGGVNEADGTLEFCLLLAAGTILRGTIALRFFAIMALIDSEVGVS
jgi:hypothetical protein